MTSKNSLQSRVYDSASFGNKIVRMVTMGFNFMG